MGNAGPKAPADHRSPLERGQTDPRAFRNRRLISSQRIGTNVHEYNSRGVSCFFRVTSWINPFEELAILSDDRSCPSSFSQNPQPREYRFRLKSKKLHRHD